MIHYGKKAGEPSWYMVFKLTGSVFPKCLTIVLPLCLLAVVLKLLHNEGVLEDVTKMTFLKDFSSWGGFSGLVNFVIVFRLSHAFTTYWAAFTSTNAMLGDWSGAASSVVVFCRHAKADDNSVEAFLQTVVRLFSMLSACALQNLSPRESHKIWGLLTLNSVSIDSQSLAILDGSSDRLGLVYHWIQQLLVDNQQSGMLAAPAPIVGRAFGELGSGMGKFVDAKKHATNQFNFPYAQTTKWLLILYSGLLPLMMVQWSDWVVGAFVFTFIQLFFTWSLSLITLILESPFDTSNPNCIDLFDLQREMNQSLLLLMHPLTRCGPPKLERHASLHADIDPRKQARWQDDYRELEKRDTIHQATLRKEGWQLKSELVLLPNSKTHPIVPDLEEGQPSRLHTAARSCCCSKPHAVPREIAVSGRYGAKRFGIVDGEQTAVFPVGIFGDQLIIAVPPACMKRRDRRNLLLDVQSLNGLTCQVLVKSIQISDRHKLYKKPGVNWQEGEFQDFHFECKDLVTDLFYARSKLLSIPLSKVNIAADLDVDEQIEAAKAVDKKALGIEAMVNLKSYDLFCKQLIEHCGFDSKAAQEEWSRRKALPDKYEQGLDQRGCVIIELDIEDFKKQFAKDQAEKVRKETLLKQTRDEIERAKSSGKIKNLEDCKKTAEKDAVSLSADELDSIDKLLLKWRSVDKALDQASQQRDLQGLETAINSAKEAKLHNDTCAHAEKVRNELQAERVERARQDIEAAKSSGKIANLEASLKSAEKDAVPLFAEEVDEAQNLLLRWRRLDQALGQASQQRNLQELEIAIGSAKDAKLHNSTFVLAEKVRSELQVERVRQELKVAKSSCRISDLEACIKNAQDEVGLTADELDDAQNLLLKWCRIDQALDQASQQRNLQELEAAINSAKEAKLHNETYVAAEKVRSQLLEENADLLCSKEAENGAEQSHHDPPREQEAFDEVIEIGHAPQSKADSAPDDTQMTGILPTLPGVTESEKMDIA